MMGGGSSKIFKILSTKFMDALLGITLHYTQNTYFLIFLRTAQKLKTNQNWFSINQINLCHAYSILGRKLEVKNFGGIYKPRGQLMGRRGIKLNDIIQHKP